MADDEFRQGYGKGFPVRADRLAEVRPDKARPTAVDGEASDQAAEGRTGIREGLARRLAALPPGHPSAIRGDRPAPADEAADAELTPRRQDSDSLEAWRDAEAPPSQADNGEGGFWSKVRRFEELWRAHVSRWPDKPDKAEGRDRREDPPGSWCGDGSQYLSPEQNAEADRLIADMRRPEEAVTKLLQEIEQDNPHGGVLVGLEHHLKGTERLKEKFAERAKREIGSSLADVASSINDAVRYTFCFSEEKYVDGCRDIRQRLESAGHLMMPSRNRWLDDPEYKGINTRWQVSGGSRFELQFHTRESHYAKEQLTHRSYDRLREPDTSWEERVVLKAYQRMVSSTLTRPARIERIPAQWEGSR